MPAPAIDPAAFKNLAQLTAELDAVLSGPKDNGTLDLIVMRPETDRREVPETITVRKATGVPGDHWARGCWLSLPDGSPDPDVQICMMMSRCIAAIAGDKAAWPPAGDNFFIDMDLTPGNMPPGTRFAIGSAEFVVTEVKHNGCQGFIDRYGRDACLFVNTGVGKELRLRGIYARVTKEGEVAVGDRVRKLA